MALIASFTEYFGNVGIVHIRTGFKDLPPLILGPDHKGVHGPLDVRFAFGIAATLTDDFGPVHFPCSYNE